MRNRRELLLDVGAHQIHDLADSATARLFFGGRPRPAAAGGNDAAAMVDPSRFIVDQDHDGAAAARRDSSLEEHLQRVRRRIQ